MTFSSCLATVRPTSQVRDRLDSTEGEHQIESIYSCEFELGHAGQHHSLGQSPIEGDTQLWIRWSENTWPEVAELPPCESESGKETMCVLPRGHPRLHSDTSNRWSR
jgi:hypothetical protein